MTALMATAVAGRSRPSPAAMQVDPSDVCPLPHARPAWWPGRGWFSRLDGGARRPARTPGRARGLREDHAARRVGRRTIRARSRWVRAGAGTSGEHARAACWTSSTFGIQECWCWTTPTRFATRTPWPSSSTPPRRCPRGLSSWCPRGASPGWRWGGCEHTGSSLELRTADLAMERRGGGSAPRAGRSEARRSTTSTRSFCVTEGWPAGLYLAALSVRAEPDAHAAVESFAGDDRLVADYLRDELLAPLGAAADRVPRPHLGARHPVGNRPATPCSTARTPAAALADLARSNAMLVALDRSGGVVSPPPSVRRDAARGAAPDGARSWSRSCTGARARGTGARRGSRSDSPCGGSGRRRCGGGRAVVRGRRSHRAGRQRGGASLARRVHARADRPRSAARARRRRRLARGGRRQAGRALDRGGGRALDGRRSGVTRALRDALAILRASGATRGRGADGSGGAARARRSEPERPPVAGDREAARRGCAPPRRTPRRRAPRPGGRVAVAAPLAAPSVQVALPRPARRSSPWTTGAGTRRPCSPDVRARR